MKYRFLFTLPCLAFILFSTAAAGAWVHPEGDTGVLSFEKKKP